VSIGLISSPLTWLNGTVAPPSWFQTVQDNLNGWIGGTGPTFISLQVDGIGSNASSAPAGAMYVSTARAAQTLPTPSTTRGAFYREGALFAAAVFDGTGAITFSSGMNIQSISRTGTGVYVVTLVTASTGSMSINVTVQSAGSNLIGNFEQLSTSSFRITVKTTAGAASDCGIHFTAFQL
jgi:hypothetical protein